MKKYLPILSILLLSMAGCSNDPAPIPTIPAVVVTGAEKSVPIGEIVTLNVVSPKLPESIFDVHYEWKIIDAARAERKMWVSEDTTSVSFGTGAESGTLTAIVDASYLYGNKLTKVFTDIKSPGIALVDVKVGDGPTPAPPVPPVVPVIIPDGQYKIAKVVYDGLVDIKAPSSKFPFLQSLSQNYKTIAQQVRAGVIKQLPDAYAALKKSNQSSLDQFKEKKEDWSTLDDNITKAVYQLYTDKSLTTLTDYAQVWTEVASGFDTYLSNTK